MVDPFLNCCKCEHLPSVLTNYISSEASGVVMLDKLVALQNTSKGFTLKLIIQESITLKKLVFQ